MKCRVIVDKNHEEEVIVYVHEFNEISEKIKEFVLIQDKTINGYSDDEVSKINLNEISCFFIEDNRVYAYCDDNKLLIKSRLYEMEKQLNDNFVKINQSCIVNVNFIGKFKVSIGGMLMIVLKNGYSDCVSRRELKKLRKG